MAREIPFLRQRQYDWCNDSGRSIGLVSGGGVVVENSSLMATQPSEKRSNMTNKRLKPVKNSGTFTCRVTKFSAKTWASWSSGGEGPMVDRGALLELVSMRLLCELCRACISLCTSVAFCKAGRGRSQKSRPDSKITWALQRPTGTWSERNSVTLKQDNHSAMHEHSLFTGWVKK